MSPEIKCGDYLLKLELDEPIDSLQQKALQELRETPENIEKGLKELKKLLEAETDLIIPKDDEKWLMKYLRRCKFYPESARNLIRDYFTLRQKYNETTQLLIPSKLKSVFHANLITIFPHRDQNGCRIVYSHTGKLWDHKNISPDDAFAGSILASDILQLEPATQINGIVYIHDMTGLSFGQTLKMTPYRTKRVLDYLQGSVPHRIKAFHIVNQPKIFEPIFAAIKPFFNEKFRSRIILHGNNYESLHKYISPECLPERYGGTIKTDLLYGPETYALLSHYEEHYKSSMEYGFKKDIDNK